LLRRHPAKDDRHQQRGRLVVGERPIGHTRDEPLDFRAGQLAAIPFCANEIDGAHGAAKSIIQRHSFPSYMADAPTLSPEVSRSVLALARTLVAAARSWALYPPEHPAVRGSLDRLRTAIADAAGGRIFSFGVTPDTLIVAGVPVEGRDAG